MNIIILSNGPGLPEVVSLYGHSSQWIPDSINQKSIHYRVIKTYDNASFDYSNADAFIITGSKYSVYDNSKWIDNLKLKVDDIIKLWDDYAHTKNLHKIWKLPENIKVKNSNKLEQPVKNTVLLVTYL